MNHEKFIRRTLELAIKARERGDYPFAAILVKEGKIVAEKIDESYTSFDPTGHAELNLIKEVCKKKKMHSLDGYELYASTEPCNMCSGAIHWSRISKVVFSIYQKDLNQLSKVPPKIPSEKIINSCINGRTKKIEVVGGILRDEGLKVFKGFKLEPKHLKKI